MKARTIGGVEVQANSDIIERRETEKPKIIARTNEQEA
jgi:hypothetical protein